MQALCDQDAHSVSWSKEMRSLRSSIITLLFVDSLACVFADFGYYNDLTGQSECFECLPGSHQDQMGQSKCQDCEPGRSNNFRHVRDCLPCDVGMAFRAVD